MTNKTFLTVVETVCHQRIEDEGQVIDSNYSVPLTDEGDILHRRGIYVGPEWQPIPGNWIEDASELVIKNHEGERPQVIPTPEQVVTTSKKIVEVIFGAAVLLNGEVQNCLLVHPGRSMRACPASIKDVRIRCREGKAKCTIAVFPK